MRRFAIRTAATATMLAALSIPSDRVRAQAPEPAFALDTLHVEVGSLVSGDLPAATRSVEVISAERIAHLPARTIADVLRWAFGADIRSRSPAQADLSIRGASFEQVLVLVDGVRVSDAQTGHFDLDLAVPLGAVERIEVLRGPASALYGTDAVGGVVNVVTRRASDGGWAARVDGGSFGTAGAAARAGTGTPALAVGASGEYRRSDGHRAGTDYALAKARTALRASVADGTLHADVAFAARDFGAADFYAPYPSYEETRTLRASVGWRPPADERFSIEPRLSARRHHDDFVLDRDDPAFYRNIHTSWQFGGQLVARYAPSEGLRIAAGGETFVDRLESGTLGDRDERRAAAFLEIAAGRVGDAALTAGVRADWHSEYGSFVAPSLAAALWPADRLRVRASTGRAFRAPTWTDRYYVSPANVGDPDLDPERSATTELGIDLFVARRVRLAAGGYIRTAEALIDWALPAGSPEGSPWTATNVANATFQGLELEAAVDGLLGIDWLARAAAISFETDEADGYTSKYVLRPLTSTVSLEARRALPGGLVAIARARRARRAGTGDIAAETFITVDARVAYRWGDARVFIDALNLGDASYLDASAVPVAGRAFYIGVDWRGGS